MPDEPNIRAVMTVDSLEKALRDRRQILTLLAAYVVLSAIARAEVRIERTVMPFDVSPSSFAIGLPGGVNFCFDPVRGGLSYAWTGDFADIAPVRPGIGGKFITPIKLLGPIFHREDGASPLRRGDATRAPDFEFKGYVLRNDAVEFRYTVDGLPVREEIRARPGGGLTRIFRVEGATDAKWWYATAGRPAVALTPTADGLFTLELPLKPAAP